MTLRIQFADFWSGFLPKANYFYWLLSEKCDVVIDDQPDILIYSVFGKAHQQYNCKKVFFSGEAWSGIPDDCCLSLTCSETDGRNYRLPLWVLYIDWFNVGYDSSRCPAYVVPVDHLKNRAFNHRNKFCCMVYNNPEAFRIESFNAFSQLQKVDSAGKLFNNIGKVLGGDEKTKIEFMSDYIFSICYENTVKTGYVTEKLLHGLVAGNIPIYWGDRYALSDFNPEAFIFVQNNDYSSTIELLREVLINTDLQSKYALSPIFANNIIPNYVLPEKVREVILAV